MKFRGLLIGLIAVPLFFTHTWSSTINLPKTGQTKCYSSGVETPCAGTGQDGEFQEGVPWPSPRFLEHLDGTVTDRLTGLMWTKDANGPGPVACNPGWQPGWATFDYIKCLNANNYLGYHDWRLPNKIELRSLIDHSHFSPALQTGHPFINIQQGWYWSSTTDANQKQALWVLDINEGGLLILNNKDAAGPIWPVRSDAPGAVSLPQTGQTKCYDTSGIEVVCQGTGQDGDLRAGVPWPHPRFNVVGDCIFDNLTGLTWMRNPDSLFRTWQDALDYSNSLTLCGFSDWRLPNILELESLVNANEADVSLWLQTQGFNGVIGSESNGYWSSTQLYLGYVIYVMRMLDGLVSYAGGYLNSHYTLPVRSGPPLLQVGIDIKPGEGPNSINPKSNGKVPVAILSAKAFNAPSQIDLNSLTFGRTGDEQSLAFCSGAEDVNKDKVPDLVCHFYTQDTGFQCGDTEGILKGKTKDGTPIEGSDSVRINPCK